MPTPPKKKNWTGIFKSMDKKKKENYSEFNIKWYLKMQTNALFSNYSSDFFQKKYGCFFL